MGQKIAYVDDQWQPVQATALHPSGARAYRVGGGWVAEGPEDYIAGANVSKLSWDRIADSDAYQAKDPDDQLAAKNQFFHDKVAPRLAGAKPEQLDQAYRSFMQYRPVKLGLVEAGKKALTSSAEGLAGDVEHTIGAIEAPPEPQLIPDDAPSIQTRFRNTHGRDATPDEVAGIQTRVQDANTGIKAQYDAALKQSDAAFARGDALIQAARDDAKQDGETEGFGGVIGSIVGSLVPGFLDAPFAAQRKALDLLQNGASMKAAFKAAAIQAPVSGVLIELPTKGGQFAGSALKAAPAVVRVGGKAIAGGAVSSGCSNPISMPQRMRPAPAATRPRVSATSRTVLPAKPGCAPTTTARIIASS